MSLPSPSPTDAQPIDLGLEHGLEVERWRPLLNWLLAIPHLVVLYVLGAAAYVAWVLSFVAVLVTGQLPDPLYRFHVVYWRYQWRVMSFVLGLRGGYPPFDFSATNPRSDPAWYRAERPESSSRLLVLVKWLLAFPHYVVISLLGLAAMVAWFVGAIAVLVTGRWPEPVHHLLVGLGRWVSRVYGYVLFLTDRYPPFSLD